MGNDLKLNHTDLCYQDMGAGYPIVLVHGMGSDHTIWGGFIPLLNKNYRVISMDLRGHGESSKPPGPYSMELFSEDINQLLHSLNIDQAHFIGHSMGGAVLLSLALKNPEKIHSLTLISTFAYVDYQLQLTLTRILKILHDEGFNAFFETCLNLANSPEFIDENRDFFNSIRDMKAHKISMHALKDTIDACLKVNFIDSLNLIKIPTLVIAGEKDVFIPIHHSRKIKNMITNSKLQIIDNAVHNMLVEQPDETYSIINGFLNRI